MSERDQVIIKAILGFLDNLQGGQSIETIIHAAVSTHLRNVGENAPGLKELQGCLMVCDQRGWVNGVQARITKQMKWSLSDEGKAALLEL